LQIATSGRYSSHTRDYRSALLRLVERYKFYPPPARRMGMEGTSTVAFSVSRNGNISGIALARSSGRTLLDQAALQVIRRIGNAPPFPNEIKRSQWKFSIPIAYSLK
jgi:protein TonB